MEGSHKGNKVKITAARFIAPQKGTEGSHTKEQLLKTNVFKKLSTNYFVKLAKIINTVRVRENTGDAFWQKK
jgi:hypothetical protein